MLASGEKVVTVEEHYWDHELAATFARRPANMNSELASRLYDIGATRVAELDRAGIDVQIVSHGAPSAQMLEGEEAIALSRAVNDRLHAATSAHAGRLRSLAVLPTSNPEAAADELERSVRELGFCGAMLCGLSHGKFLDTPDFWPIYARAEQLDVPIYFHPSLPHPAVAEVYYKDYVADFAHVLGPAWGFTVEAGTQALRLVLSGVFEKHPNLKIVLGHLGEGLPFMLWRIDHAFKRPGQKSMHFREVFSKNFYITTSGFFSDVALRCSIDEMGLDHVLFAIDYPFVAHAPGMEWLRQLDMPAADKAKLAWGNATRLFKL